MITNSSSSVNVTNRTSGSAIRGDATPSGNFKSQSPRAWRKELKREMKDREQSEDEIRKTREDLYLRMHDQSVAREISTIPKVDL
ncbi:hypothetical protein E2542_SST29783 [Spatholobus suberectus]|nr:hypothetical protein E2542_SST29783 [Spatholobus suberectus]